MLNWKGLFRSHILERGWDYANEGSVADLVKTDDSISAVVRESEYYKDRVFYAYSDRPGYIDYYNAMLFESDLNSLLRSRIGTLIDNESYMNAFNASMYALDEDVSYEEVMCEMLRKYR